MTENVPPIKPISDIDMDKLKAELGIMSEEIESATPEQSLNAALDTVAAAHEGRPTIRRRRGRPRKYERDIFDKPIKDKLIESDQSEPLPTLASPPLTTRDGKEAAKRLKGILIGATSLGATVNPTIQMTEQEADNIAVPLTSYLLRTEATSQIARRILDEYDIAAFVIATLAYMVRVMKEVRNEREQRPAEPAGRPVLVRTPTSARAAEYPVEQVVSETSGEDENGQEGPIDRQRASTIAEFRNPTEV